MSKKVKSVQYVCQECGGVAGKWLGKCPDCGNWNTMVEESVVERDSSSTWTGLSQNHPVALTEESGEAEQSVRISTEIPELDRVLGGGIVEGSLVLIGGDPGIGKSTIMLQLAHRLAQKGKTVIYLSGEESETQIRLRAARLECKAKTVSLHRNVHGAHLLGPGESAPFCVIVDSIQTMYTLKFPSVPGSVGQIRETAMQFLTYAKQNSTCVFLTGHVTKDGTIAGPRLLEHLWIPFSILKGTTSSCIASCAR